MEKEKITIRSLSRNAADRIKAVINDPDITRHIEVSYEMQELSHGSVDVTLTYQNPADLFFLGVYCYRNF